MVLRRSDIQLKGEHNVENVFAAVAWPCLPDAPPSSRQAVSEFRAVEHRLEFVTTINGVSFYNDSKATNVDATVKALDSFPGNIHLILGGKDKGSDYTELVPLAARATRPCVPDRRCRGKNKLADPGRHLDHPLGTWNVPCARHSTPPNPVTW